MDFKDEIKGQMASCSSGFTRSYDEPELIFSSKTISSNEYCIVTVDIMSKRKYMVWDGSKAVFEPITLKFALRQAK